MKLKPYKSALFYCAALAVVFLGGFKDLQAQTGGTGAVINVDGPDAIAVRVVPNPNHYSILRWYESQGFIGSPQALVVDGYEAIRDGRTVYVSAANVSPATKEIYTNIYLISYNQSPLAPTVDILGQLLSKWKFNSNLNEPGPSTCSLSSLNCQSDSDCPTSATCAKSGLLAGSCVLKEDKNCLADTDCPNNFFCGSLKAKITRDIKRVGQVEDLKRSLVSFRDISGRYPDLSAGTYLSGHSLSVWPSWSGELLRGLAIPASVKDPINRLGPCIADNQSDVGDGYDPVTCWNNEAGRFINSPVGSSLTLPAGSYALLYSAGQNGISYNLCATMESRGLGYKFSPNDPADSSCLVSAGIGAGGLAPNSAPRLVDSQLAGEPNARFNGYIQVVDPDGDNLSWSWESTAGHSTAGWNGWVNNGQNNVAPVLLDTSSPNQKKVYADKSGSQVGVYNLTLKVTDGRGGVLITPAPITLLADPIMIEAPNLEHEANPNNYFNYKILFYGNGLVNPNVNTPIITKISGPVDILSNLEDFSKNYSLVNGKNQIEYRGLIPSTLTFSQDTPINYRVSVTDSFGATASKNFSILIKAYKPYLNFNCLSEARVDQSYFCLLGSEMQGGHKLSYSLLGGAPSGLMIKTNLSQVSLTGVPDRLSSGQAVTVQVKNEYGASSTKSFNLKVNSFCGDGRWQSPNTEGRGGIFNDGYEDCDGNARVVKTPANSSIELQYGCSTTVASSSPYPILSNSHCSFLPPSSGGGYCGDGYCQVRVNGVIMENAANCAADCEDTTQCVPSCDGKSCGNDGCGGSCGVCTGGTVCSSNSSCIVPVCSADSECDDGNLCSQDICLNPGTGIASCSNSTPVEYSRRCIGATPAWYGSCAYNNNGIPTSLCSTGICEVEHREVCLGLELQPCAPLPDPRLSYCANKCEGEPDNFRVACLDGEPGKCRGTGNGSACAFMGEEKSCSSLLGLPAGSFSGNATCNSNCSGYDTSGCEPSVCDGTNPTESCYWQKASDDTPIYVGQACTVKMPVDSGGQLECGHKPSSGGSWQWFVGQIDRRGVYYCAVPGCQITQVNRCKYENGQWSNQCYVRAEQQAEQ